MNIYNQKEIIETFYQPSSQKEFDDWLKLKNIIPFLEKELNDEYIILYAFSKYLFLHSILIPNIKYEDDEIKNMIEWSGNPFTTWSILKSSSSYELHKPYNPLRCNLNFEQIIFGRQFEA
ncbi:hypothetical protein QV08_09545 [Gallibacterium salpingitidis]|uniref:hypothetical protein n=1 Tax=Gallibacterium salpingitidis TaxID=505341 RepID=UPI00080561D2|nr:hypothetical protein [Gallibacterium salpingitidis]OBX06646.1 hypothetical protein QV08_09545 [Gallibacterium salpingitidis]